MNKRLQTFFPYYGAKYRLAPHYPVPRFDTLIELFAGSACYALAHPNKSVILVEKYPVLAGLWRYLLKVSEAEILSLPDIKDRQSTDDLNVCEEARWLIGFWINQGVSSPRKTPSSNMKKQIKGLVDGSIRDKSWWGAAVRQRIASQLQRVRHWQVIEGDYTTAPVAKVATYFIDPPYQNAGKHYRETFTDFGKLAQLCTSLTGQVIVCEAEGADWLPFKPFRKAKSMCGKNNHVYSKEMIWTNDDVFPPEGWHAYPDNPHYFHNFKEVLTESQLRARMIS